MPRKIPRRTPPDELGRLGPQAYRTAPKRPLVVVLDDVRSMHNVGSVFRTADAFRIQAVWLCGITARPPHRDIRKTALGAEETVAWRHFDRALDAVAALRETGYAIRAVEQATGAEPLGAFHPEPGEGLGLVFGHEVRGVDEAVLAAVDGAIEIPQHGTKHSLNVSVAVGVVLWELTQGRSPG